MRFLSYFDPEFHAGGYRERDRYSDRHVYGKLTGEIDPLATLADATDSAHRRRRRRRITGRQPVTHVES